MANYAAKLSKATTSATVSLGSIEAPASGQRRIALYDIIMGSDATPADNAFLFELQRSTTAATGTAVTPLPLDPADAAAAALAKSNNTVDGTKTAGQIPLSVPLNQRATFRWVAAPGSEIIIPATASNGLHINTPTAINTPAAEVTTFFREL